MPIAASARMAQASRRPVVANGVPIHTTAFIGTNWTMRGPDSPPPPTPGTPYPMAFLVEQPPGSVVRTHFHSSDQFQVVVAGGGLLGRHPVAPVTVHYTNAHTAYGPIQAGEAGLHYFTLRNCYDAGARYIPEATEELKATAGRRPWQVTTPQVPPAGAGPAMEELLEPRADGLGAWLHRLAPGARLDGPDPALGAGQFWLVVSGALLDGAGEALPPLSLVFVGAEEAAMTAAAGPEGAECVVMQYPRTPATH